MRAPNPGERKLTEPDFIRLGKFTAAGAFSELTGIPDNAELVPSRSMAPDVVTIDARCVVGDPKLQRSIHAVARRAGAAGEEAVAHIERILFQPEATGDYVT